MDARQYITEKYIKTSWKGFEVGAYFNPWPVHKTNKMHYVDKYDKARLEFMFMDDNWLKDKPERMKNIPKTTFKESGEECTQLETLGYNFCVTSHVFEHTEDPLRTLAVWFSKIKVDGIIAMAVPDKNNTFDKDRALTSWQELYERRINPEFKKKSIKNSIEEWCSVIDGLSGEAHKQKVDRMIANKEDIHFNVWNSLTASEFFQEAQQIFDQTPGVLGVDKELTQTFEILDFKSNGEIFFVLKKVLREDAGK